MLRDSISKQATSARDACAVGNGNAAELRIDELKRTIALVADLLAATKLADSPPHNTPPSYSAMNSSANHSHTELGSGNMRQEHHVIALPAYTSHLAHKDMQGVLDSGDGSRKRCASSMAGDRVIKSMKLEPQEDVPLHIPQTSASTLHLHQSTSYPTMPPFIPSNPSSSSPSRPVSPVGLSSHTFPPVLQPQPHAFTYGDLDLTSSAALSQSEYSSTSSTPTHTAPVFPPPPVNRMSWSDGPATFQRHHHTSSGSSLVGLHGLGLSSSAIPFTAPGAFGSAPNAHLSQQRAGNGTNGVPISPSSSRPIGRLSRSGSVSGGSGNPFAFNHPEHHTQEPYASSYARSTTTISAPETPVSSPEAEQYESDMTGDYPRSQSPSGTSASRGRSDSQADMNRPSTGHHSHNLTSQSSPDGPGSASSTNGNEVPQEYRSEVDRIFFEFLGSICSNCEFFLPLYVPASSILTLKI